MITFLLLLIGILLVVLNVRAIKDDSFDKKMKEVKDNTGDFELKLGEMRKEFAETVFELQKDIEALKDNKKLANSTKKTNVNDEYKDKGTYNENPKKIDKEDENSKIPVNSTQIKEIEKLFKKGLSESEISQKLGIGKGEILLIKDLYLK